MQQQPSVAQERVYLGVGEKERDDRISSTNSSNNSNNFTRSRSDFSMKQMMERRHSPINDDHSPKKFKSGTDSDNYNRSVHIPSALKPFFLHEGEQRQESRHHSQQHQHPYENNEAYEPLDYHEDQHRHERHHHQQQHQQQQQHPQHYNYHHDHQQHEREQYHINTEARTFPSGPNSNRSQSLTPPPRRVRSYQPQRSDDHYTRAPPRRSRSDRIHRPYPPHHQQHHNPHHANPSLPVPSYMGSSIVPISSNSAFEPHHHPTSYESSSRSQGGGFHHPPVPRPRDHRRPVSYVCASSRKCYPSTALGKRVRDEVRSMTDGTSLAPAARAVHYHGGEPEIPRGIVPDQHFSDPNYQHHHHRPSRSKIIRLLDSTKEILDVHSVLGRGTFSVVSAVTIKEPKEEQKKREQSSPPRYYACKSIKEELLVSNVARMGKRNRNRSETYLQSVEYCVLAASQLAYEAHILSCLDHPNIVKMRGLDADGILGFEKRDHRGFFLLMDVLTETLDQKIDRWRSEKALSAAAKRRRNNQYNRNQNNPDGVMLWRHKEKLDICLQLASALEYLHSRRVVYRDLKPSNVGFITDEDRPSFDPKAAVPKRVQLFDFGLSRELTPNTPTLQGAIGTMRYMAPEVCLESSYDCDCDIYSYAIVCWEIWTQRVPFENVATPDLYRENVCQRGYRPVYRPEDDEFEQRQAQLNDQRYQSPHQRQHPPVQAVPNEILLLLSQAWKPDPKGRIRWPKTRNQLRLLDTLVDLQLEERQLSVSTPVNSQGNQQYHTDAHHPGTAPSFNHQEEHGQYSAQNFVDHHHATYDQRSLNINNDDDNHSHFQLREEDLKEDLGI